jgi:hypothetical protein
VKGPAARGRSGRRQRRIRRIALTCEESRQIVVILASGDPATRCVLARTHRSATPAPSVRTHANSNRLRAGIPVCARAQSALVLKDRSKAFEEPGHRGLTDRADYLIEHFRVRYAFGGGWTCGCAEFAASSVCRHTREAAGRRTAQALIAAHLQVGAPRTLTFDRGALARRRTTTATQPDASTRTRHVLRPGRSLPETWR